MIDCSSVVFLTELRITMAAEERPVRSDEILRSRPSNVVTRIDSKAVPDNAVERVRGDHILDRCCFLLHIAAKCDIFNSIIA